MRTRTRMRMRTKMRMRTRMRTRMRREEMKESEENQITLLSENPTVSKVTRIADERKRGIE